MRKVQEKTKFLGMGLLMWNASVKSSITRSTILL